METSTESNVIDFSRATAKLMSNRALAFLMSKSNEKAKFSSKRLMSLNGGAIITAIRADKDGSGVHLNFKFKCVECEEVIKIQYVPITPNSIQSNWIVSICDTCDDELSLGEDDDE